MPDLVREHASDEYDPETRDAGAELRQIGGAGPAVHQRADEQRSRDDERGRAARGARVLADSLRVAFSARTTLVSHPTCPARLPETAGRFCLLCRATHVPKTPRILTCLDSQSDLYLPDPLWHALHSVAFRD